MFKRLSVSGIKGIVRTINLDATTVITGPNEAGKSAVLEAVRLAINGKADVGGGRLVGRIMSSRAAHAQLIGDGVAREWTGVVSSSDTVSSKSTGDDTQGGMPISVEEWSKLSNAEKFSLVAGNELCQVVAEIEGIKEKLKECKRVLDAPPLPTPEMYDGDPLHSLEERLTSINLELRRHSQCSDPQRASAREREEKRLEDAKADLATQQVIVDGLLSDQQKIAKKLDFAEDMLSRYREAVSNEPKLVAWGREKGLSACGLVRHVLDELRKSCEWLGSAGGVTHESMELFQLSEHLKEIVVKGDFELPLPVFPRSDELYAVTRSPQEYRDAIADRSNRIYVDLETARKHLDSKRRSVERIEQSLSTELAIYGDPLSPEVLLSLTGEKEFLEGQIAACRKWDEWGAEVGKQAVARTQAVEKMAELDEQLEKLNTERARIVNSVAGGIERLANATLERAGMQPIAITVEATAKQASLVVSREGVHIDALAKSRKLACGIAVLSAIQQVSGAKCPVLVAECAEMDKQTFERFAKAVSPDRGNVILEHHIEPDMPCVKM